MLAKPTCGETGTNIVEVSSGALLLFLMLLVCVAPQAGERCAESQTPDVLIEAGRESYRQGRMEAAARCFTHAYKKARQQNSAPHTLDALMYTSDVYRSQGRMEAAILALDETDTITRDKHDPRRRALVLSRYGATFQAMREFSAAREHIEDGLIIARELNDPELTAALYNDLGNVYLLGRDITTPRGSLTEGAASGQEPDVKEPTPWHISAAQAFENSQRFAAESGNQLLSVTAGINLTKVRLVSGAYASVNHEELMEDMRENLPAVRKLPNSRRKAELLVNMGALYRATDSKQRAPAALRRHSLSAHRDALTVAQAVGDSRTASYAAGYIGEMYEEEGLGEGALYYYQKAAFAAQEVDAHESHYRWQLGVARLLRKAGRIDEALIAYRRSIDSLDIIRLDLTRRDESTFQRLIARVFYEYADLLLEQTAKLDDASLVKAYLEEAQTTVEQLKHAEIEDYFGNQCVLANEEPEHLDQLTRDSAVIYPVLLSDRIELLISLPDQPLGQYTTNVSRKELDTVVTRFRRGIESRAGGGTYEEDARQLYEWLVQPYEDELAQRDIETLVFVPDGLLRSIPLGALRDDSGFLIEEYAIATTLGLELTSPHPIKKQKIDVLIGGLTKAVGGFPSLPYVSEELENISSLYDSSAFQDEQFLISTAEREMSEGQYSVVHIASHGQFKGNQKDSFLLTFDDKLTMDRLESTVGLRRFQEEPLEMLVLSACQTAAGDERSALGLAGVAITAGARSALATLWAVNDQSTASLISEFYAQLKNPDVSKAEALRLAQLKIREEGFDHPRFWAPFIMIGNWL
ncbi:MAG: CHAT domain-containing protein [Gammaproteobacteria bacterium]